VLFSSLGESIVFWYDHAGAIFSALDYTNRGTGNTAGFTNTLRGGMGPAAYSGARGDVCPLAGKTFNAVLTQTNKTPRPASGYLRFAFDKAGAAKIVGILPENRPALGASRFVVNPSSEQEMLPCLLFGNANRSAHLSGMLMLASSNGVAPSLNGSLRWVSGKQKASFDVVGSVWTPHPRKNVITGTDRTATCRLVIGNSPPQVLLWPANNKPFLQKRGGVTFKFDAKTGTFSGTVPHVAPNGRRSSIPYSGIMFQSTPVGLDNTVRGVGIQATKNGPAPVSILYP
jgi:hypothetical protein